MRVFLLSKLCPLELGWFCYFCGPRRVRDPCPCTRTTCFFFPTISEARIAALCNWRNVYSERHHAPETRFEHRRQGRAQCRRRERHLLSFYQQPPDNRSGGRQGASTKAERQGCRDVWACCVATLLHPDKHGAYTTSIPATEGLNVSTEDGCKPQVGSTNVSMRKGSYSELFFILNGPNFENLYNFYAFHHFLFSPDEQ